MGDVGLKQGDRPLMPENVPIHKQIVAKRSPIDNIQGARFL